MKANLHLHSLYSDGYPWPCEIVKRARENKLDIVSLTDHDCMNGVEEFMLSCNREGITGIPGVEIDCFNKKYNFRGEILGYFPDGKYENTLSFTHGLMKKRVTLMKNLLEKGRKFYREPRLNLNEMLINKAGSDQYDPEKFCFSKPDLLYLLRKFNILPSDIPYPEYKKLFKEGGVFNTGTEVEPPQTQQVIEIILSDGGYPVLAHPVYIYELNIDNRDQLLEKYLTLFSKFRNSGIWGIELNYYNDNTSIFNEYIREAAEKSGFRNFTVGSDCHGRGHEHDTMEKYAPDFAGFA